MTRALPPDYSCRSFIRAIRVIRGQRKAFEAFAFAKEQEERFVKTPTKEDGDYKSPLLVKRGAL